MYFLFNSHQDRNKQDRKLTFKIRTEIKLTEILSYKSTSGQKSEGQTTRVKKNHQDRNKQDTNFKFYIFHQDRK